MSVTHNLLPCWNACPSAEKSPDSDSEIPILTGAPLASEPLELAPLVDTIVRTEPATSEPALSPRRSLPFLFIISPLRYFVSDDPQNGHNSRNDHSVSDWATLTMRKWSVKRLS